MTIYHISNFIDQGKYEEMKYLEYVTNSIKENIREFQLNTDKKRIEWKEQGVVSKFVSNKEYSWDRDALKELFFNLGILVSSCSICNERLSEDQANTLKNNKMKREERYVRFSPNKQLKLKDNVWWADVDISNQLTIWREHYKKFEVLSSEWERLRKIAAFSSLLQKERKVVLEYGTISLLEQKPSYLVEDFLNTFGINELFNAAIVDISRVEELAARGFICMSDIKNYRETTDIKLKFYLMEISKEQEMFEFMERRRKLYSHLSIVRTTPDNSDELPSKD
jgi:hypothetical protein